jgi:hypothetical protein
MRVQRIGSKMKPRYARALWRGFLAGLSLLALAAPIGERPIFAQNSPLQSTSTGQLGISPEAMPAVPEPDPSNPVAVQSANLLKAVYTLKLEVDKTTKDTLSVSVVRKAAEIEQMARKMRTR